MSAAAKAGGRPVPLRGARQFETVFADGIRARSSFMRVIARPNEADQPRLGFIIAKRRFPRAVDRNRLRRLIRESVACYRNDLHGIDLIVTPEATAIDQNNSALRADMDSLWQKLASRLLVLNR